MPIPFKTHEERMHHPQAKLIPQSMWSHPYLFAASLDEAILELMINNQEELSTSIKNLIPKLNSMSWMESSNLSEVAWLATALSHSDLEFSTLKSIADQLNFDDAKLFDLLAILGNLTYLTTFLNEYPSAKIQRFIEHNCFSAYQSAARHGHLEILKYLESKVPNKIEVMITGEFEVASYQLAASGCNLEILKHMESLVDHHHIQTMVVANKFRVFKDVVVRGSLEVLKHLESLIEYDQIQSMISDDDFEVYKRVVRAYDWAADYDQLEICNHLLSQSSACFAYAEQHVREYSHHVIPFIDNTLSSLHQEYEAFSIQNPNGVFDIEGERAQLCFYLMRNLIRRNDRAFDDELRFLLSIPSVKALVHQELTAGNPNELLRLAMTCGNQEAATLLLNIEAVRRLAELNNFYREEARNGVDLRRLAQDRESSMVALTEGEKKKLESAIEHYQPMINQVGIDRITEDLRAMLIERYKEEPALINIKGKSITLPVTFEEFQSLNLSKADYEKANKAYYQNKAHSALRYLSKPNLWMHRHSSYVYINEQGERWSTFEEYLPVIAIHYLAAIDKEMEATKGYTLETRIKQFINELAFIGRAHNWDKTRIRNNKREEYDDLEGDRPSCFSGVKRRLFQSVIGHSLFDQLTEEKIEAEIRQFAFEHFKSVLTDNNKYQFKTILDEIILELDEQNVEKLQCFNIPSEKQDEFMHLLAHKYGAQFSENIAFIAQAKAALTLNPKAEQSRFRYHVLTLLDLTGFYQHLELLCPNKEPQELVSKQHEEPKLEHRVNPDLLVSANFNNNKQHQSATNPGRNQASMFKKEKTVNTGWEMSGCEMISWACFPVVGWLYLLYYAAYHTCCSTAEVEEEPINKRCYSN